MAIYSNIVARKTLGREEPGGLQSMGLQKRYNWVTKQQQHIPDTILNSKDTEMCVCVYSVTQSCLTLCDGMDCSPLGSSFHGTPQARILEWGAISFSRVFSWPRYQIQVFCISRWILYHWGHLGKSTEMNKHQIFTHQIYSIVEERKSN